MGLLFDEGSLRWGVPLQWGFSCDGGFPAVEGCPAMGVPCDGELPFGGVSLQWEFPAMGVPCDGGLPFGGGSPRWGFPCDGGSLRLGVCCDGGALWRGRRSPFPLPRYDAAAAENGLGTERPHAAGGGRAGSGKRGRRLSVRSRCHSRRSRCLPGRSRAQGAL